MALNGIPQNDPLKGEALKDDEEVPPSSSTTEKRRGRIQGSNELCRALSERHVNMIAFSSTIGIGLFLQSGKVIYLIGPGGAVLAYLIMGSLLWSANASLGEMTAVFPVKGPIIDFPSRFLDEGLGFAAGWMAWFAYINLTATEVSALTSTFKFQYDPAYLASVNYPLATLEWGFGLDTDPAIWVGLGLFFILLINLLPVRAYGEIEYIFGCFKLMVIIGIILMQIILNASNRHGNTPKGSFTYYKSPYSFFSNSTVTDPQGNRTYTFTGGTGHLVGIWSAMNTIFFSLQGFFTVSVTAAENKDIDRDETIKLATRKIALRVVILYALVVFTTGLNVPYNDINLQDRTISSIRRGANSPIMISCIRNGVTGWPHFFNAFYIFSAFSTGVNGLYISSRLLHALASIRNVWPATGWGNKVKERLEKTNRKGVPVNAVLLSWLFAFLGFLAVKPEPAKILGRLAIFSTCSMLIVYLLTSLTFLSFKSNHTLSSSPLDPVLLHTPDGVFLNRNAADYPYKSHGQWMRSLYAVVGCGLLILFNGWRSFLNPFSQADFLAAYLPVVVCVVVVCGYHFKDESVGWKVWRWRIRRTGDVGNPVETREKDPEKRKGRLHRVDRDVVFSRENVKAFFAWVWVWLK